MFGYLLFLSLVFSLGLGEPCYLSSAGSDHAHCSDQTAPCLTLHHVVNYVNCSSVVVLTNLTVTEGVIIPSTFSEFSLTGISPNVTHITCLPGGEGFSLLVVGTPLAGLALRDVAFHDCRAAVSGGVLLVNVTAPASAPPLAVQVERCTFTGCAAPCGGACLDVAVAGGVGTTVTLTDVRASGAIVGPYGGQAQASCGDGIPQGGAALRLLASAESLARSSLLVRRGSFVRLEATGGAPTAGGALLAWAGQVRLEGSSFLECTAGLAGGAVALSTTAAARPDSRDNPAGGANADDGAGSVEVARCAFAQCGVAWAQTQADQAGTVSGGAIEGAGRNATLVDCEFTQCTARGPQAQGGAVRVRVMAAATVEGSSFRDCAALSTVEGSLTASTNAALGGALALGALAGGVEEVAGRLHDDIFLANQVAAPTGRGGAVSCGAPDDDDQPSLALTVGRCLFSQNQIVAVNLAYGGALDAAGGCRCACEGTRFEDNQAAITTASPYSEVHGGALAGATVLTNCTLNGNAAASGAGVASGGAAFADGSIAITGCRFQDNALTAAGDASGGAVDSRDSLTVEDSDFVQNQASCSQGAAGGALSADSDLTCVRCNFTGNGATSLASRAAGGAAVGHDVLSFTECVWTANSATAAGDALGGALASRDATAVMLTRCPFERNQALSTGASAFGGAVYLKAYWAPGATVEGCRFLGNAVAAPGTAAMGGALCTGLGALQVNRTEFAGNRCAATRGGEADGGALAWLGGGPSDEGTVGLVNVTFRDNTATGALSKGGAAYASGGTGAILEDVLFAGSAAVGSSRALGGALAFDQPGGPMALGAVAFVGNSATSSVSADGGGLAAWCPTGAPCDGSLNGTGLQFEGNGASCPGCLSRGGSAYLDGLLGVALAQCDFVGVPPAPEAVFQSGGCLYAQNVAGLVALEGASFVQCHALGGGGAVMLAQGRMALSRSRISRSTAAEGGALRVLRGNLTLADTLCQACRATYGGCISATDAALALDGATLEGNVALESGGAIELANGTALLVEVAASRNSATGGDGGVLDIRQGSRLRIEGGRYAANRAFEAGGVLTSTDSEAHSAGAAYLGNAATTGGAWFVVGGALTSTDDTVSNGTADGGAVGCFHATTAQLRGTVLTANRAAGAGGCLEAIRSSLVCEGVRAEHNGASLGGAVFLEGAALRARGCRFSHNIAFDAGGPQAGWGPSQDGSTRCPGACAWRRRLLLLAPPPSSPHQTPSHPAHLFPGALLAWGSSNVSLIDTDFLQNTAISGGALSATRKAEGDAGGALELDGCLLQGNTAVRSGTALRSAGNERLAVRRCRFVGQAPATPAIAEAEAAPSATAVDLLQAEGRFEETQWADNDGGALALADGARAELGAGCRMAGATNRATFTAHSSMGITRPAARPVNAWLVGGSELVLTGDAALLQDNATGALWLFPDASSAVRTGAGPTGPALVPLLEGTLESNPATGRAAFEQAALREVQVRLASADRLAAADGAVCFVRPLGPGPALAGPFWAVDYQAALGRCALPLLAPGGYELLLSNDGGQRNASVGTFTVYQDRSALLAVGLATGGGALGAGALLALLAFVLGRACCRRCGGARRSVGGRGKAARKDAAARDMTALQPPEPEVGPELDRASRPGGPSSEAAAPLLDPAAQWD
ncbi:hypothetical protein PAPYR_6115 [Paratrimastix pyriformis]|uniref:Polymorphic outer membrane protein n=1 Tax=Paratrimastix pyriformis TaxID=342808 RepID=A0ABQ8UFY3_9EUKA|nr:hypothetical protein PAPYR_6115 [Paratrimastix pyriformis]